MASEKRRDSNEKKKKKSHSDEVLKKKKKQSNFKDPKNPNRIPLGSNRINKKKNKKKNEIQQSENTVGKQKEAVSFVSAGDLPASQQLSFFLDRFQAFNGIKLSSLELESIKETCIVEQAQGLDEDSRGLSKSMKNAFGKSWKEILCDGQLLEGKIDPGSPAVLVISTSALRSLELLRGLPPLTRECRAAKLFAKHMKVEDQVSLLKSRVNIASGTPNRIKKLIEMDALGLSRLAILVLDMHSDAKGYSLFTLPQVSGEFWDLYNAHFHQKLVKGELRICLYGPIPSSKEIKDNVLQDE